MGDLVLGPVEYLGLLFKADFMQGMLLAAICFLIPLKKRSGWKGRLALLLIVSLLANYAATWQVIAYDWVFPFTWLYYGLPLLSALLVFLLCHDGAVKDALYGTACAYAAQHIMFCCTVLIWGERWLLDLGGFVLDWLIHLLVFGLCYFFCARRLATGGQYQVSWRKSIVIFGVVLFIAMLLNRMVRDLYNDLDTAAYAVSMIYDLFCCVFVLLYEAEGQKEIRLQAEIRAEQRIRQQMKAEYELSRETIDIINRKSHDLKHQISALRLVDSPEEREASLQEVEQSVQLYDMAVDTGDQVLDTVLTEKGLICRNEHIAWTCMAKAGGLDFISPVDLYTLLGNALDNAIESSRTIADQDRRVIRVTVRESHGAVFFQIENYYEQPLSVVNGLPRTTKKDAENHGFGLQSIRAITERYDGTMDIETEGGRFLLTILLPIPERKN